MVNTLVILANVLQAYGFGDVPFQWQLIQNFSRVTCVVMREQPMMFSFVCHFDSLIINQKAQLGIEIVEDYFAETISEKKREYLEYIANREPTIDYNKKGE